MSFSKITADKPINILHTVRASETEAKALEAVLLEAEVEAVAS